MVGADALTGGAVVGGIVAILFALRPYLIRKREMPSIIRTVAETAGNKDAAFWERRFDKLETAIATVDRIIREHRHLTHSEVTALRDLLVEIDTGLKVAAAMRKELR